MTSTVALVVTNLLYLAGAIVVAALAALVIVIRQRKPRSVEANMDSFHKGLRALAPDDENARPAVRPSWGGAHRPVLVRPEAADTDAADTDADAPGPEGVADEPGAGTDDQDDDAPVELASRQQRGEEEAGEEPLPSEETGTG